MPYEARASTYADLYHPIPGDHPPPQAQALHQCFIGSYGRPCLGGRRPRGPAGCPSRGATSARDLYSNPTGHTDKAQLSSCLGFSFQDSFPGMKALNLSAETRVCCRNAWRRTSNSLMMCHEKRASSRCWLGPSVATMDVRGATPQATLHRGDARR